MFLAEAQSGIRHLALPRTSLTLFCLFLAAVAQVNHSAALLAIAEKLPRTAAQLLSVHYVNKTPCRLGSEVTQLHNSRPVQGHEKRRAAVTDSKSIFRMSEKSETAALFLSHSLNRNVQ